jgi:hypothetical protein
MVDHSVFIHVYRDPREVAVSLHRRNAIPTDVGLALWEYYNVAALNNMHGKKCVHVCYNDLMKKPQETVQKLYDDLYALDPTTSLTMPSVEEIISIVHPQPYRNKTQTEMGGYQGNLFKAFKTGAAGAGKAKISTAARKVMENPYPILACEPMEVAHPNKAHVEGLGG